MTNITALDCLHSGFQYLNQHQEDNAIRAFETAVTIDPKMHQAWFHRARLIMNKGAYFDAVMNFNQALAAALPDRPAAYLADRGAAWLGMGQWKAAVGDFEEAINIDPTNGSLFTRFGNLYMYRGESKQALENYVKAIELDKNQWEAGLYGAMAQLSLGQLEPGWKNFEVRWSSGQLPVRDFKMPHWEGEDLNDKTLLLHGEQGIGDQIQFMRYALVIANKYPDASILIEVRRTIAGLAQSMIDNAWRIYSMAGLADAIIKVIAYGDHIPLDRIDYHCPMMSAARVCGTTMKTIPAWPKYCWVDPYRADRWRKLMSADLDHFGDNLVVGLCWAGGSRPHFPEAEKINQRRSTKLMDWLRVGEIDHVCFLSLQQGEEAKQARRPPVGMKMSWGEGDNVQVDDFMDTAAMMVQCDMVISVDTAVAHVAAALGIPTLIASRYDACWRWHFGENPSRIDTPWYPTARVFRQDQLGDWPSCMAKIAAYLEKMRDRWHAGKTSLFPDADGMPI